MKTLYHSCTSTIRCQISHIHKWDRRLLFRIAGLISVRHVNISIPCLSWNLTTKQIVVLIRIGILPQHTHPHHSDSFIQHQLAQEQEVRQDREKALTFLDGMSRNLGGVRVRTGEPNSNGLQPKGDGLEPTSDGLLWGTKPKCWPVQTVPNSEEPSEKLFSAGSERESEMVETAATWQIMQSSSVKELERKSETGTMFISATHFHICSIPEVKQLLGNHGQNLEQLKQMSDELQRDEKSMALS